jgi:hypothetical protein
MSLSTVDGPQSTERHLVNHSHLLFVAVNLLVDRKILIS